MPSGSPGQAEAGRAQDSEDAPAPAEQISGSARSLQATADRELRSYCGG